MTDSEEIRRPRPIGVADDSDEDDMGREQIEGGADPEGGQGAESDKTAVAATEDAAGDVSKKPSKKRPAFSENNLVMEKGLIQIYNEFPKKCQYKGRGREAEFLRGLMVSYKEWGYQLFPGLAFEDLASRTEKLGGKARVRDLLTELRDMERDRVLEAKYGRSAVDSVHAQEVAKVITQETAPVEVRGDEEPANSRYMEVDEEGDETSSGGGIKVADEARAKVAADMMSDEVRQRMEINRRQALERLRLKKEEAAAAKEQTGNGTTRADAGMSVEKNELMDLMDTGEGGGGPEEDFEEDELALAEMMRDDNAKPNVASAGAGAPIAPKSGAGTTVAPVCSDVAPPASLDTSPITDGAATIANSAEATAALEDVDTDNILGSTARTQKDNTTDIVADEPAPVSDIPGQKEQVDGATSAAKSKDADHHAIASAATNSSASSGIPISEPNTDLVESPGDSIAREEGAGGAGETAAGEKQADSAPARGANGGFLDSSTHDAGKHTAKVDGQATFSSPGRCKTAVGEVALSPLGSMFARTDVPLEGGLATVDTPRGGLFADESL